jgi:CheY-like chemotaxis protein
VVAAKPNPGSRRAQILVVDDDPMVARAVKRALQTEHDVEIVLDAREGLVRLLATRFDVIFCDLMMSNMTGMELHAEVTRLAPETVNQMVFMTGGAFTEDVQLFLDTIPNITMWKPFNAKELREIVQTVLDRPRA